jgi:hypothetical protein
LKALKRAGQRTHAGNAQGIIRKIEGVDETFKTAGNLGNTVACGFPWRSNLGRNGKMASPESSLKPRHWFNIFWRMILAVALPPIWLPQRVGKCVPIQIELGPVLNQVGQIWSLVLLAP